MAATFDLGLLVFIWEMEKMKEDESAHPVPKLNNGGGFTKREYAAILLRVPDSKTEWLDEMIRKSFAPPG